METLFLCGRAASQSYITRNLLFLSTVMSHINKKLPLILSQHFQSISFPSEQGVNSGIPQLSTPYTSKGFPINQFPQRVGSRLDENAFNELQKVSNQLVSLASREKGSMFIPMLQSLQSFQSISFPSEQGVSLLMVLLTQSLKFPINQFPQRVGSERKNKMNHSPYFVFPINQFPQRVGRQEQALMEQLAQLQAKFPINQFPQRVGSL